MNAGDRVVHLADASERDCSKRDHGTFAEHGERTYPEHPGVVVKVGRVRWDDGGETNGPIGNLQLCRCP